MFIRHAEKPPKSGDPPRGVRADGETDSHALVVRGWTRAGALVAFFAAPHASVERPTTIFAAAPNVVAGSPHGERAPQTVTPLGEYLNIDVDATYGVGDEAALAAASLAGAGVALVCWEHHAIPAIVANLPGQAGFSDVWDDGRFDLVWMFDLDGAAYRYTTLNQSLLSGDAT